ncbi:MAG: D-tyrosyl-tRNA(Tyr) deacylase [SAR202 cluster bacterium Io17-Chloro-G9]|nr:MAG: D-tyrosyl-tRNA(Tyr) deacylase [SAR202 cluster bacterium Io17-Chloro-G9]
MRALLQRVVEASVEVDGQDVGRIGPGMVVLLGVSKEDEEADAQYLVEKLVNLRIFADGENRFNLSALDVGAEFLLVSQFTLYADTRKGRRPGFTDAAQPEDAQRLYEHTLALLQGQGVKVATGRFQEHMQVRLQNDGPVTILLDSADRHRSRRG